MASFITYFTRLFADIFGKAPNSGIVSNVYIDSSTATDILKNIDPTDPGVINLSPVRVYSFDSLYKLATKEDISKFLDKDLTEFSKFVEEKQDCDNFAVRTWGRFDEYSPGFVFGLAISCSHAFNIFMDNNRKIYIIEPQTDEIIPLYEAKSNKIYWPIIFIIY